MNRIHRVVWNAGKGVWQAVSECARVNGKVGSGLRRRAQRSGLLAGALLLAPSLVVAELPTGGEVTAGSGSISQAGSTLTVHQDSARLAIDWQSFSIGAGHSVNFVQPSSAAVALNRVVGSDVSRIQGALNANGQVFLINPNGVVFSTTAQVNVGSLVATTLALHNDDFLAGNYRFAGTTSNPVINEGAISASEGGTIALLAAQVVNEGSLRADGGNVLIGAGDSITLDMGGPVKLQVDNAVLETLIRNGGAIRADGGTVWMTSQAAGALLSSVINNSGTIEAQGLGTGERGEIVLFAHGGTVEVGGRIHAQDGFVETSGRYFSLAEGVDIQAGHWLIDPVNIDIDAALASAINTALAAGDVTVTTDGACVGVSCTGSGSEGNIDVNAALSWNSNRTLTLRADNNISVNADITHTGSSAGGVIFLYGQGSADGGSSTYTASATVSSPSLQWRKGSDPAGVRYAIVDDNYFIGNRYIELGICGSSASSCTSGGEQSGKFGTANKPSLFFGRQGGRAGIGMVGDADGFGSGADLRVDYFLPGSPAEQFTVQYFLGGTATQGINFATAANSGSFELLPLAADGTLVVRYSGVLDGNLKVEQQISLKPEERFFNNEVTLTNVGGSALDQVRFARSFDPDNTQDAGGSYTTIQRIEQSIAAGDSANVVSATSLSGDSYYTLAGDKAAKIIYYSTNAASVVGFGGPFFGGSNMASMVSTAAGQGKGDWEQADSGMGIIYTAGTLAAGASKSFSYLTSLDNRDIAAILAELGTASGASTPPPPLPPASAPEPQRESAITAAQVLPLEPLIVQQAAPLSPAPQGQVPAPVQFGSESLPVFDVAGGLAFVHLPQVADGTAGDVTNALPLPDAQVAAGGQDVFGFMRVFVVAGGINDAFDQTGSSAASDEDLR